MLLDHEIKGKLGAAYDRETLVDERFELCQWWVEYLKSAMAQPIALAA